MADGDYPLGRMGVPPCWDWMGVPPPPPPNQETEQQSKHLLRGGRYASWIHAGGLSWLKKVSVIDAKQDTGGAEKFSDKFGYIALGSLLVALNRFARLEGRQNRHSSLGGE